MLRIKESIGKSMFALSSLLLLLPYEPFIQIKPKDHHYNLIFLLDGKGASCFDTDRNETVLSKQNIHVSSDLLAPSR